MLETSVSMPPSSDNFPIIDMITISVYVGGFRVHATLRRQIPIIGMITISVYFGGFPDDALQR